MPQRRSGPLPYASSNTGGGCSGCGWALLGGASVKGDASAFTSAAAETAAVAAGVGGCGRVGGPPLRDSPPDCPQGLPVAAVVGSGRSNGRIVRGRVGWGRRRRVCGSAAGTAGGTAPAPTRAAAPASAAVTAMTTTAAATAAVVALAAATPAWTTGRPRRGGGAAAREAVGAPSVFARLNTRIRRRPGLSTSQI